MSATLQRAANALGAIGILGVGALTAGISAYFGYIAPLAGEVRGLSEIAVALPSTPDKAFQVVTDAPPGRAARDREIAAVLHIAENAAIRIIERRLEEAPVASDGLRETRMRAVFEASYSQLRKWLDATAQRPNLDWQSIRFDGTATARDQMRLTINVNFRWSDEREDASTHRRVDHQGQGHGMAVVDPFNPPQAVGARITAESASAPPELPYTYSGRYLAEKGEIFLLSQGDLGIRVRAGDLLPGGAFRLEGRDGEKLVFIHLASQRRIALGPDPGQPQ